MECWRREIRRSFVPRYKLEESTVDLLTPDRTCLQQVPSLWNDWNDKNIPNGNAIYNETNITFLLWIHTQRRKRSQENLTILGKYTTGTSCVKLGRNPHKLERTRQGSFLRLLLIRSTRQPLQVELRLLTIRREENNSLWIHPNQLRWFPHISCTGVRNVSELSLAHFYTLYLLFAWSNFPQTICGGHLYVIKLHNSNFEICHDIRLKISNWTVTKNCNFRSLRMNKRSMNRMFFTRQMTWKFLKLLFKAICHHSFPGKL